MKRHATLIPLCTGLCIVLGLAGCGRGDDAAGAAAGDASQSASRSAPAPRELSAAILITDVTLDGRCSFDSPEDRWPGASIIAVELFDSEGGRRGLGDARWHQRGTPAVDAGGPPPDGQAPTSDACETAFNLGCDGRAAFGFRDGSGRALKLREGDTVVVALRGEHGCGETYFDEVAAAVCTDPAAVATGALESCTASLRMVKANSDHHGPDRMSGKVVSLE